MWLSAMSQEKYRLSLILLLILRKLNLKLPIGSFFLHVGASRSLQVEMPDTGLMVFLSWHLASHSKHLSGCPLTIPVMTGVEVVRKCVGEGVKVVMLRCRSVRQATYTRSCSCWFACKPKGGSKAFSWGARWGVFFKRRRQTSFVTSQTTFNGACGLVMMRR